MNAMNKFEIPSGFWWSDRVLFRVEVGSTAHGTNLEGQEDYDEIAVASLPPNSFAGIDKYADSQQYRPGRSAGEKSQPGDWDLVIHSAQKWATLCVNNNPSLLNTLFSPVVEATDLGRIVLNNPQWFITQKSKVSFLGYMNNEYLNSHKDNELGYVPKKAMHSIRLGMQGVELAETGRIQFPIDTSKIEILKAIRLGKVSYEEYHEIYKEWDARLQQASFDNLPPKADMDNINNWLVDVAGEEIARYKTTLTRDPKKKEVVRS